MTINSMTSLWARTALVWFLITICVGFYLGGTQQFGYSSPHAHLGLLGWLSSIAFAFLYRVTGADGRGPMIHWGLHNIGTATMVVSLFLVIRNGGGPAGAFIGLGGLVIILATLWLIVMLWPKLGAR